MFLLVAIFKKKKKKTLKVLIIAILIILSAECSLPPPLHPRQGRFNEAAYLQDAGPGVVLCLLWCAALIWAVPQRWLVQAHLRALNHPADRAATSWMQNEKNDTQFQRLTFESSSSTCPSVSRAGLDGSVFAAGKATGTPSVSGSCFSPRKSLWQQSCKCYFSTGCFKTLWHV